MSFGLFWPEFFILKCFREKFMKLLNFAVMALVLGLLGNYPRVSSGQAVMLEEIVVTARRREENLMEVPVSISVLSSEILQDPSMVDQFDLFEMAP